MKGKDKIRNKFAQHFDQLLNTPGTVEKSAIEGFHDIPAVKVLDSVPSRDELNVAISSTRDSKAPGGYEIPAEVWKHGGLKLQGKLHDLPVTI